MLLDVSKSPKINCDGVGISTMGFDTHFESFSCDLDKSSRLIHCIDYPNIHNNINKMRRDDKCVCHHYSCTYHVYKNTQYA